MRMEEGMQRDTSVLFKLGSYLLTDLGGCLVTVRQIKVLYELDCELIGCDQSLVQVPEEVVAKTIRNRHFLRLKQGIGRIDVGVASREGRTREESGNVEIDADGNQGERQTCLRVILLIRSGNPRLAHPFAMNALYLDGLDRVLANLLARVDLISVLVASEAAQAGGTATAVIIIVVVVIVAIFCVIDDGRAALGRARERVCGKGTGQNRREEGIVVGSQSRRVR